MAAEMRYGDYIKGGLDIVKANIVPSVVLMLLPIIPFVGLVMPIFVVNYLAGVKAAKHQGKPIALGDLFNFENAVDKWVGLFIAGLCIGIGNMLFVIPGIIAAGFFYFVPMILADKPGTPFMNAIKGSISFAKANAVPCILVAFIMGLVGALGMVACGIGMLITMPISLAAGYLCYEDHKAGIEAAAAQGGVQL
jgi:uncharacterized membrane protein